MLAQPSENIPPLAADLARMQSIFARQQLAHSRFPMPALADRKQHLAALRALLIDHKDAIAEAISADFTARSVADTLLGEIIPSIRSIDYARKRLRRWMKPSPRNVDLNLLPASACVVYQPLGVVGIMVPFNYPVNLAVVPLATALAAGNRVMIKMSEFTPQTADLMEKMLRKYFDEDHVAVVTGEADIGAAFSRLPFDHLLFTGSMPVGKHVIFMTHGHINFARTMLDKLVHVSTQPTLDQINRRIIIRLARIRPRGADIVVFGHTHKPCAEWIDGVLYFNPGAVCHTEEQHVSPSIGRLILSCDGTIKTEWFPVG